MAENLGASFSIDIGNLKAGLAEANRLIRQSNSEFLATAATMDDWSTNADGLAAKNKNLTTTIDLQTQKVEALKKQKEQLIQTMTAEGASNEDISRAVDTVNKQIEREAKALIKSKSELDKNEKAMKDLASSTDQESSSANDATTALGKTEKATKDLDKASDDASDSIDGTSGALDKLKSVGGAVGGVLASVGGAVAGVVTSFFALAEGTRETRTELSKVQTAFDTTGKTAEQGLDVYNGLYSVLGDSGQATEAANNIAQLADTQKDLNNWVTISTGVYATFGDSLPIEGLAEAANETAKVGAVTGPLADALNWVGVSEDEFNEKLAACNSEQERSQLITSTLTGLYGEAAAQYQQTAGDIMDANAAQNNLNQAMAGLGAVAEPVMTVVKNMGADILSSITPSVDLIGQGLTGAMTGAAGSADLLGEGIGGVLDSLISTATDILPTVTSAFSTLVPAILNSLISALPTVLQAGTDILNALLQGILSALPQLVATAGQLIAQFCETLGVLLPDIVSTVIGVLPSLVEALIAAVPTIITALLSMVTAIVEQLPTIIQQLITALPTIIDTIIMTLMSFLPDMINAAITLLMAIVEAIPQIVTALTQNLPTIIDTIISAVLDALPMLLQAAIQLLLAIVDAIPQIIPVLVSSMPKIISSIVSGLTSALPKILTTAGDLFMQIIQAIIDFIPKLPAQMGEIITSIVNGLSDGISKVKDIGKDLIEGLWNGIKDMSSWILDKIKGFGESILGGLKDFFGINSPSKLLENEIGKNLALGVGEGFTDEIGKVNKQIVKSVDGLAPSIGMSVTGRGQSGGGVTVNQYNTYAQAHTRYELFKSKQQTAAAVRLAMAGVG